MTRHRMRITDLPEEYNAITEVLWAAAIEVHSALGPHLLESAYRRCLFRVGILYNMHAAKLREDFVRRVM